MKDDMDFLLRHALTPTAEDAPNPRINQKILQTEQEDYPMRAFIKKPVFALLAAAIIASGSLTAYAAWHYLNPSQVAKEAGDDKLAEAFHSNNAIFINQTQVYGKYKITLNGMISGKSISSQIPQTQGELQDNRTYAVISIARKDGTLFPESSDNSEIFEKEPFTLSPFIQGQPTDKINIFSMNGGVFTCINDGIQYKLIDCDNLEVFGDREVYLGVTDTNELDTDAYQMDEKGILSRNEKYSGVNALFTLPLDKSKADSTKAENQLKTWLKADTEDDAEAYFGTESSTSQYDLAINWTPKQVQKKCEYLKQFTKNLKPDKEGLVTFSWEDKDTGTAGNFKSNVKELFKDKKPGTTLIIGSSNSEDCAYIEMATKKKDGSYTVKLYRTR